MKHALQSNIVYINNDSVHLKICQEAISNCLNIAVFTHRGNVLTNRQGCEEQRRDLSRVASVIK